MKKIIPIIASCVLLLSTLVCTQKISYVYGAESNVATYTLLEPLPCLNDGTQKCTEGKMVTEVNFADYVRYAFNLIIALSAVAAVLVIVVGGFRYVTTDSFQGKNEGKKTIIEALKGLLLVLCSFLILRTIDPRLVDIPTTLVKPLDIKYEVGLTERYLNSLSNAASKNAVEARKAVTEARQANLELGDSNQRISELEQMIAKDPNSAASQRMREEIANIKIGDEYKSLVTKRETANARSVFLEQVSAAQNKVVSDFNIYVPFGNTTVRSTEAALVNGTLIDAEFATTIESIEQARIKRVSHPDIINNQEAIKAVNEQAYYAKGVLLLEKVNSRLSRMKIDANDKSYDGTSSVYFSSMGRKSMTDAYNEIQNDLNNVLVTAVITKMPNATLRNEILSRTASLNREAGRKFSQLFGTN